MGEILQGGCLKDLKEAIRRARAKKALECWDFFHETIAVYQNGLICRREFVREWRRIQDDAGIAGTGGGAG